MFSSKPGFAPTLLLLAAALVSTTACSPDTSGNTTGPAADASLKITIGELSSAVSHTPIYVGIQQGFFAKSGLDVSLQQLSGGTPAAMAALATGGVNMMYASANEFIQYSAKKIISGKIVGEVSDSTFDVVVTKGISNFEQLKGKTIGISGANGADQIYLEALLRHYSMSPKDVASITSGSPANRLTALSSNSVQAIAVANSYRDISSEIGTVLLTSHDSPIQIPGGLLFANIDLVTNHQAGLKKLMNALAEATAWIRENPAAAAANCSNGTGITLEACEKGIATLTDKSANSAYTWSSTFAVNIEGVKSALEMEITRTPEAAGITLANLIDTSIAGTTP